MGAMIQHQQHHLSPALVLNSSNYGKFCVALLAVPVTGEKVSEEERMAVSSCCHGTSDQTAPTVSAPFGRGERHSGTAAESAAALGIGTS